METKARISKNRTSLNKCTAVFVVTARDDGEPLWAPVRWHAYTPAPDYTTWEGANGHAYKKLFARQRDAVEWARFFDGSWRWRVTSASIPSELWADFQRPKGPPPAPLVLAEVFG